jgi:putative ATP-dependent endonuclease of OLD family
LGSHFAEFEGDPALTVLLTDYRLAGDHHIARLTYVFRKKADVKGLPQSESDFEFRVFGGGDETRQVKPDVRRRICIDVLHALRDAEGELAPGGLPLFASHAVSPTGFSGKPNA